VVESDADAKMERTRNRPIPAGIIRPGAALLFGLLLLGLGVALVWIGANPLAGALTAATAFSYLFLYTPLKTLTSWCTLVGSLPGAIPPIIGTAAKLGHVDRMGWLLFALLFCWQVPHFMALAVMCREDYARGGFKVATVDDPSGRSASVWAMTFILPMIFAAGMINQNVLRPGVRVFPPRLGEALTSGSPASPASGSSTRARIRPADAPAPKWPSRSSSRRSSTCRSSC
jgi:protoheme IX farnesyltransferase